MKTVKTIPHGATLAVLYNRQNTMFMFPTQVKIIFLKDTKSTCCYFFEQFMVEFGRPVLKFEAVY